MSVNTRNSTLVILFAALAVVLTPFIIGTTQSLSQTKPQTAIGFIGDSITVGADGSHNAVQNEIADLGPHYRAVNRGISGTKTSDWTVDNRNFTDAAMIFQSEGVHVVSLMLGTNDAINAYSVVSPEEYASNIKSTIYGLLDRGVDKVIVNYPPFITPGIVTKDTIESSKQAFLDYRTQLDTITTGNARIVRGDTGSYDYFEHHLNELVDGVHPNDKGYQSLGKLWADAYEHLFPQS
ncbi:MAG: Lysophospholipase and related esterase [Candidatus Saccharibacteria bacterium]|nr:Lysophospholipase and related esterase [Candidatus Saccharibacteria bacterium]